MRRSTHAALLVIALTLVLLASAAPAQAPGRAVARAARAPATPRARAHKPRALAPGPATGALGLDLLRRLASGNVVFSPENIAVALAMTGSGAKGQTAAQIAAALHLSSPASFVGLGTLQGQIAAEQAAAGARDPQAPTLDMADGLFVQEGFALEAPFQSALQQRFGAVAQGVDFAHNSAGAVHTIDSWVSTHTQGLIPELFASLTENARLVLAAATYLKASWQTPFKAGATAPAVFHGASRAAQVPFMHETESLPYAQSSGWAAVALPYRSSTLSLLLLLPRGRSLAALERTLDPTQLARIAGALHPGPVALSLPRIHLTLHTSLVAALEALGITDAFGEQADFSGISQAGGLKIGEVQHAADLRLDEAGTVAAAATGVEIEATALHTLVHPVAFDADRPFLFFLRDNRTGAVLFAGRLSDAAAAQG
jgi:serpin B